MDIDDPDEAARKVYFEYLADRYKDEPTERRQREDRFDNDSPKEEDRKALKKAVEAYTDKFGTGEALNAARDAFYLEKFRHDYVQKNTDPKQRSNDIVYYERTEAEAIEYAKQQLQTQQQGAAESKAQSDVRPREGTDQELIDRVRGGKDQGQTGQRQPGEYVANETIEPAVKPTKAAEADGPSGEQQDQQLIDRVRGGKRPEEPQLPSRRSNRNDYTRYRGL